jgi:hypothetical protein
MTNSGERKKPVLQLATIISTLDLFPANRFMRMQFFDRQASLGQMFADAVPTGGELTPFYY